MRGLGIFAAIVLMVGGVLTVTVHLINANLPDDPPTIAAENLAYARFGSVCPRGVPRSDVCQVLFRDVEKAYLAQHGGYR